MREVEQKITQYFSAFSPVRIDKGTILLLPDEPITVITYIEEGSIEQLAITDKGERVVVNVFRPGAFMPLAYVCAGLSNSYFFEACEDLVVRRAPAEATCDFVQANPDVMHDLLQRVYRGSEGILKQLVLLMSGDAHSLLINRLVIEAKRLRAGQTDVVLQMSEAVLAARTGLSRETISRELQKLKKQGLVTGGRAKLTVHDIVALEAAL